MIIYKATNKENGMIYIGQTTKSLDERKRDHISNSRKKSATYKFPKALKECGIDGFIWEIVYECESKDELNEKEIYFIDKYKSLEIGYNSTIGGDGGNCGNQMTKSGRKAWDKMTPEKKDLVIERYFKGENHFSKRNMTQEQFDEWKKNRTGENNGMYGKTHSDDFKKNMSERRKEYLRTHEHFTKNPEVREKIKQSKIGEKNPMSRSYKIEYPDGRIDIIKGLTKYCRDNNITRFKLMKQCIVSEIKKEGE